MALLQADGTDAEALKRTGNDFADSSERIIRHLNDEEEIVVPVMLNRGEVELMGG